MNDLVMSENNQVVTSSLKIAEVFKKQHKHVLDSIEKGTAENSALLEHVMETTYTTSQNKQVKMYYLDRDAFSYIVMGFTGKKAAEWKWKYIEAFNEMEAQLNNPDYMRLIAREAGKVVRRQVTDSVKLFVEDSPNKHWAYKNYTDLIYFIVFKKSAKDIRIERGLPKDANIRDYLTESELVRVRIIENAVDTDLQLGYTYEEIKAELLAKFPNGVHLALERG